MNFLAPFFLLGALAVALPVVFHLIRRSPRIQRVFSSLMLLSPATPRITRRSRLDQIPLLLLRCAVVCLLALAFARPFWRHPMSETPPEEAPGKSILLLDVSASMQREGLWPAARRRAEAYVAQSGPADQVAVYTFDRRLRSLVTFDEWNATPAGDRIGLVHSRLAGTQPGWAGTVLDQALIRCAELLTEGDETNANTHRQVVLLTDLQEGSRTADLQAYEWPQGVSVRTERLTPGKPGNAGLQWMAESVREDDLAIRLRISSAPDSNQEQFQVGWARPDSDAFQTPPVEVYVPAGQSRVLSLAPAESDANGKVALLTGDGESFDNRVFVIPPTQAKLDVLFLGQDNGDDGSGPLYFLRRAFPDTARQQIRLTVGKPDGPLPPGQVQKSALIVATTGLSDGIIEAVREAIEQGGTLLFAAGNAACAPTLARLTGVDRLSMTEVTPRDYAMLGNIDYRHPLFAPFADERFSDFTGIHFWRYRRMDASEIPEARVLARFDNEDPALLEVPVGNGRILLLTSGWFPADSQLALSSKFVPLLFSALELGGRATRPDSQRFVGDTLEATSYLPDAATVAVEAPDGTRKVVESGVTPAVELAQPGLYTLESSGAQRRLAVNIDPREDRTAPLPVDELERLGVPGPATVRDPARTAQRRVQLHNAELESRQKLWHWIILAVLALLLAETGLAGRACRRAQPTERVAA